MLSKYRHPFFRPFGAYILISSMPISGFPFMSLSNATHAPLQPLNPRLYVKWQHSFPSLRNANFRLPSDTSGAYTQNTNDATEVSFGSGFSGRYGTFSLNDRNAPFFFHSHFREWLPNLACSCEMLVKEPVAVADSSDSSNERIPLALP